MGWFDESKRDEGEPTLAEAWTELGRRLGLAVEVRDESAITARGTYRGRPVDITVEGRQVGTNLLRAFATTNRKRVHQRWTTDCWVACQNPAGFTGILESIVDINDPRWQPGRFDPTHCRVVRTHPPELASWIVSPTVYERLFSVLTDDRIDITANAVGVRAEQKTALDGGFVAGSPIHRRPGPIVPWPERALVGPPWWLDLLVDVAEHLDAARP